eukprot:GDKI01011367.1.p1 GENE.GDKI01011367.1~~GDKI01011367.1.p1  ORF type:complete len:279 (-),score=47.27 GDKI01011367.1:288-1085(-)
MSEVGAEKQYDFFLGHTKRCVIGGTQDFVNLILRESLEARGYRVFYDQTTLPGKHIESCLEAAKNSMVHVVILDLCTPESTYVLKEIEASINAHNPIVGIFRKDKFTFKEIGKYHWVKKLLSDPPEITHTEVETDMKTLIRSVFSIPAIPFDADPQAKDLWLETAIGLLEEVLRDAGGTPKTTKSKKNLKDASDQNDRGSESPSSAIKTPKSKKNFTTGPTYTQTRTEVKCCCFTCYFMQMSCCGDNQVDGADNIENELIVKKEK